ncbi:SDR family NAD(P)-dependent oxidoreductase [Solwaraspora sp. WMMB335]|uniref:SDR family NAD(P)-dependent oxidoreductase n=1 Tax=Solwaraspora sp. WMMB335 TaxID=3404118 RepID=UPI003B93BF68
MTSSNGAASAAPTPLSRALDTIRKLRAQLDAANGSQPVAVVGVGLRLPGGIDTLDGFWQALAQGRDLIGPMPPQRMAPFESQWQTLPRLGGFLDDVLGFDAAFFGISPREARALDPQHRLLLEVCHEALEQAGRPADQLRDVRTGFYLGITHQDYRDWEPRGADAYWATGNGHCFAAGRVAYALGLTGPAVAVDTACSSSLVAVHQAASALRRGECEVALAGGVNLIMSPRSTRLLGQEMGALAPDGRCKAFDARANGFTRGEGCVVFVLKRLDAALADRDVVHAVIDGSAVNQDGRSSGFTAPNVLAQKALIEAALADARLTPADIGLVETHGTGTALGDPIEMEALATVLGRVSSADDPLFIGAVKTNLGHVEAAAGAVGMVKAILSLRHRAVAPLVHFDTLNPRIDLSGTRITVPTGLLPWPVRPGARRHAGISSFGMSGTNAHVILGEPAPATDAVPSAGPVTGFEITAASRQALHELAARLGARLAELDDESYPAFAYTVTRGRARHAIRARVDAADPAAARTALTALATGTATDTDTATVTVYSGDPDTPLPELPRQVVDLPHYPWQRQRYAPLPEPAADPAATAPPDSAPATATAAPPSPPGPHATDEPAPPLYELVWQPLDRHRHDPETVVIAGDDEPLVSGLAAAARASGVPALVLGPGAPSDGAGPLPRDDAGWTAFWRGRDPDERVCLLLAYAADRLPSEPPAGPPGTGEVAATGDPATAGARICAAVTAAVRAMPGGSPQRRVVALTSGTRRTGPDDPVLATTHGLLHGLAPVLGLECPAWGGLVDLPAEAGDADLRALLRALPDGDGEDLLAIRQGAVWTARLRPASPARFAPRLPIDPDARYLVTGGLGGVGRALVRDLVRRGARHLLLVGRRAATDLAPTATDLLAQLAADGIDVGYRTADCADPLALAAALAEVDGPPLRGVVHAAGELARTGAATADEASYAHAVRGKFTGAWWLHLLTRDAPLDFFVITSSVSALWGTDGYGGYAAANGGADLIAGHRVALGLPATSIAFGPWAGDGMVDQADLAELARGGVDGLSASAGCAGLAASAPGHEARLVCCPVRWPRFVAVMSARRDRALFRSLLEATAGPAPGSTGPAAAGPAAAGPADGPPAGRARLLALPELARPAAVREDVAAAVAAVLGYADGERVDTGQGLFDLGLDSMMAVDLVERLAGRYGVPLQVSDVFDHPTVAELAARVTSLVAGAAATPPAPVTRPPGGTAPPARELAGAAKAADVGDTDGQHRYAHEPIAIVGMAGRFPGADSVEEFWNLLIEGRDGVGPVPADRWDGAALHDDAPTSTGTISTDQGGFLRDVDRFDAAFFDIPAREAQSLDPQHRLLLECAWHALEDAEIGPNTLRGTRTGVFVGISNSDYARRLEQRGLPALDAYFGTGTALNAAAGRVAYLLGLHGPAMAVDTACSSALVATHLAIRSLRTGESDTALVGGVNVVAAPAASVAVSRAHMLSPSGRCKTFAADADGFVRSEAAVVLVLKPLAAARRDGDRVLALLRGSAVNSDGASSGLTAPNGRAQQAVLRAALTDAGVAGRDLSYLETHGTGTALGDPVEVNAAWQVLGEDRPAGAPLHLGSVKSNVGHCESASGLVSIVKAVLALRHGRLPANLHCDELNPQINWAAMNVRVLDAPARWRAGAGPRLAGVSSFGFSGTNAHVVVAEAPATPVAAPGPPDTDGPWLLPLSAADDDALARLVTAWDQALAAGDDDGLPALVPAAGVGRAHLPVRRAVLGTTVAQLRQALAQPGRRSGPTRPPRIAFLFSGQGSQYFGMGRELYETEAAFRETFDACDEILAPQLGGSLPDLIWYGDQPDLVNQTSLTQPALVALELSLAALWAHWGVTADAVIGHSVGEITAAIHAGVLDLRDGLTLIVDRARLMQATQPGGMLSVAASAEQVRHWLVGTALDVAAINGPLAVVVAGPTGDIESFASARRAEGVRTQRLTVSHAFHSRLMEPMLAQLRSALAPAALRAPLLPIVANLTGELARPDTYDADYWCRHVRQPVLFHAGIERLHELGVDAFLEIGPGRTLAGLVSAAGAAPRGPVTTSLRRGTAERSAMLAAVRDLYEAGQPIRWAAVQPRRGTRTGAPERAVAARYPFAATRFWVGGPTAPAPATVAPSATTAAGSAATTAATAMPAGPPTVPHWGRRLCSPALSGQVFEFPRSPQFPRYLTDHRLYGTVVTPAASHLATALSALAPGGAPLTITDLICPRALVIAEHEQYQVQLVVDEATGRLRVLSLVDADRELWQEHLAARLSGGATGSPQPSGTTGSPEPAGGAAAPARRAAFIATAERHLTGDRFYAYFRDLGYTLGPSFRWIADVWLAGDEALVRYARPALPDDPADYEIYPGLIDSCFQSLAGFLVDDEARQAPSLAIPFSAARVRFVGRPGGGELWGRVRVRAAEPLPNGRSRVSAADLSLHAEDGSDVLVVDDFRVRHAPREVLQQSLRSSDAGLYTLDWAERPDRSDDAAAGPAAGGRTVLLLGGDLPGAGDLAGLLRGASHAVLVDDGGNAEVDLVVDLRFMATAKQAGDVRAALARLSATLRGVPAAVPYAVLCADSTAAAPGREAIWGLLAALEAEEPGRRLLRVQLPGLDDRTLDPLAGVLHRTLAAGVVEPRIRIRDGRVAAARLATAGGPRAGRDWPAGVLISGGLGALGLSTARMLADGGTRAITLLGRSAPAAAAKRVIDDLTGRGVRVAVVRGDVADPADCAAALAAADRLGPLHAVLHLAGATADGAFGTSAATAFDAVFAGKVYGAEVLATAVRDRPSTSFVLFSSISSVFGAAGQTNYAAANGYLNGLAMALRADGVSATSVNWGPWEPDGSGGMAASAAVRRATAQLGVRPLSDTDAAPMLVAALSSDAAQVVAVAADLEVYADAVAGAPRAALVAELVGRRIEPNKIGADARAAGGWLRERLLRIADPDRGDGLREAVAEMVAEILGTPARINDTLGFAELGLDSIMAIDLRTRLSHALDIELPATVALDHPTVLAMTSFVGGLLWPPADRAQPAESEPDDRIESLSLDDLVRAARADLAAGT